MMYDEFDLYATHEAVDLENPEIDMVEEREAERAAHRRSRRAKRRSKSRHDDRKAVERRFLKRMLHHQQRRVLELASGDYHKSHNCYQVW